MMSEEEDDDTYMYSDDDCEYSDYSRDELDAGDSSAIPSSLNYVVLEEEEVCRKLGELCRSVTSLLSIPNFYAKALLRYFRWDINRLNDEWFSDEDKVRELVGLPSSAQAPKATGTLTCGICFETFRDPSDMFSLDCSHAFCRGCSKSYIVNSINEGPACLDLRCVDPSCKLLVTEDAVLSMVDDESKRKYSFFYLRSFVEGSKLLQWCPAPGCTKAVECFDASSSSLNVACSCGFEFCFNCGEECHRPVNCAMRRKWIIKNSAESENLNWILANSKPCPKCKRPIEKYHGCMHMTCVLCKHEFCWLCLGPWGQHGERTGGFYACNKYEAAKTKGSAKEESRRRDFARVSLERYMHYFERWAANKSSCAQATAALKKFMVSDDTISIISENTRTPISQLKFISEAWGQVIKCRRTLMWTYAYGYYNFSESRAGNLKEFFEFLQGDAECNLELLHNCIEVDLMKFADEDCGTVSQDDFNSFRSKLTGLTKVTRDYFDKLQAELENGLEEIQTKYGSFDDPSSVKSPTC